MTSQPRILHFLFFSKGNRIFLLSHRNRIWNVIISRHLTSIKYMNFTFSLVKRGSKGETSNLLFIYPFSSSENFLYRYKFLIRKNLFEIPIVATLLFDNNDIFTIKSLKISGRTSLLKKFGKKFFNVDNRAITLRRD